MRTDGHTSPIEAYTDLAVKLAQRAAALPFISGNPAAAQRIAVIVNDIIRMRDTIASAPRDPATVQLVSRYVDGKLADIQANVLSARP